MIQCEQKTIMTAEEIVEELKADLEEFGTYDFYNHGAGEVSNVKGVAQNLSGCKVEYILETLKKVTEFEGSYEDGGEFVRGVLQYIEEENPDLMNKLTAVDSEFIENILC